MPRMFAVVPLLVLALSLPGKAIAGPPEGVSGKMVLDEVADGLRKYRKEKDAVKRLRLLEKLAPTRDPRVAIVLVEARPSASRLGQEGILLIDYFIKGTRFHSGNTVWVDGWWEANEVELRRRAKQLPQ
jgi:hypothetical protein